MAYFDNINHTLLDLIQPSATRICELGCGAGALAAAIQNRHPTISHYVGIEIEAHQLELAKPHLSQGVLRNLDLIESWNTDLELASAAPLSSFDHIILGDVLEHLYYPEKTLREAVARLKIGGSALICIPNVQHWSVFLNLVRGTWPREDAGLFDRTHIRWFTLDDMLQLVNDAGLQVESIHPRIFESEQALSILEDLEPLARNIGVDPDMLIARGQVLQFAICNLQFAICNCRPFT